MSHTLVPGRPSSTAAAARSRQEGLLLSPRQDQWASGGFVGESTTTSSEPSPGGPTSYTRGVTVQVRVSPGIGAAGAGSSRATVASSGPTGVSASAPPPDTQFVVTWSRLATPPDAVIGGQSLSASNRQKLGFEL